MGAQWARGLGEVIFLFLTFLGPSTNFLGKRSLSRSNSNLFGKDRGLLLQYKNPGAACICRACCEVVQEKLIRSARTAGQECASMNGKKQKTKNKNEGIKGYRNIEVLSLGIYLNQQNGQKN